MCLQISWQIAYMGIMASAAATCVYRAVATPTCLWGHLAVCWSWSGSPSLTSILVSLQGYWQSSLFLMGPTSTCTTRTTG